MVKPYSAARHTTHRGSVPSLASALFKWTGWNRYGNNVRFWERAPLQHFRIYCRLAYGWELSRHGPARLAPLGISGAQWQGAAGTPDFEPDGV